MPGSVGDPGDNDWMSDEGGLHVRQSRRNRTEEAHLADISIMVRVPGEPDAVRVYTADEQGEATAYAAENGGVVVPLPVSPPRGYAQGPHGDMVPHPLPTVTQ